MKKSYFLAFLFLIVCSFTACKNDPTEDDGKNPVVPYLNIAVDTVYFSSSAAEGRIVDVDAIDNSWIADCQADWCKINTSKNSLGIKEIRIGVLENPDTVDRECIVTVTLDDLSQEFVVKQMAMQSDDATEMILEQTEYEVDFPAGEFLLPVIANGTFTVQTDSEWLVYREQQASEDGCIWVKFDVAQNSQTEVRNARITLSSRWTSATLTLTQNGYQPLYVSATELKAGFIQDTVSIEVVSIAEYSVTIEEGKSWITVVEDSDDGNAVKFAVEANPYKIDRSAEITVTAGADSKVVTVTQIGAKEFEDLETDQFADDVKVPVLSATASSERISTNSVDRLFDGDYNTYWATVTNSGESKAFIEANFDTETDNTIDYMSITHTSKLSWGQFGQIEVYAVDRNGVETKVADADCGQVSSGSTRVHFEPALNNVAKIRIEILTCKHYSTYPNSVQGCAAEIEFFQKNPENFDPLTIFTDMSCSQIRSDVGLNEIESIENEFYKSIAEQIYMGVYNEFRVCEAKPYPHPDRDAAIFRTNTMTLIDNVTGMYIPEAGKEHIILVGEDYGQTLSISVIDWVNNEGHCQNTQADYAISKGRNKITIKHKGLIYIKYHTDNYADLKPVTVNFPTASVNGYFDVNKHDLENFYTIFKLASSTECPHFDMISEKCLLNYAKTTILSSTLLSNAKNYSRVGDLLAVYDSVFKIQERIQGHDKYKALGLQRGHRNKGLFSTTYGSTYGFSAAYKTAYNAKSMAVDCCNPTKLWNRTATSFNNTIVGGIWGLAHELGHSNQTEAFKWIGLTEVTNNLMCAAIQTVFYGEGNTTMRFNDHFNKGMRDIATRMVTDRDGTVRRMTHCESVNTPIVGAVEGGVDPTTQLEPFWQLYLYYHLAMGNTDFYPDFYELCRTCEKQPSTNAGQSQYTIDFIKRISDAAGEDLSDFCAAWGLPGVNNAMKVTHYGTYYITTTQAQIDEAAAYCKKYPKPKLNPLYINDLNIDMYRNPKPVTAGTHTYADNGVYTMSGWSNVVAWKLVDPQTGSTLCIHTNDNSFTFAYQATVYINNSTGTDYMYNSGSSYASSDTGTMRALQSVEKVYYPDALVYGIAADGTEVPSLSNSK